MVPNLLSVLDVENHRFQQTMQTHTHTYIDKTKHSQQRDSPFKEKQEVWKGGRERGVVYKHGQ
jgi:hypothetical protein